MNIKHKEIDIDQLEPFKNCKLDREKYADILTSIVESFPDGFILALNNEWGTGKTTFIKMWQQHLINLDYKTLYYNAWENDFEHNPLVAIMSELKSISAPYKEEYKSLLNRAAVFSKALLPTVIKALADRHIKHELISDLFKNAAEGATEIIEEEVKAYTSKKEKITDFKKELTKFGVKAGNNKPIIFIIDELDRCRPNYAVELLEQVKHLFSVPGIIFILSIDKKQLQHAIRGVYGSEQINAEDYLRRFIDLEYSLPTPSIEQLCEYFYSYFKFEIFFNSENRMKYRELEKDSLRFIALAQTLFSKKEITIRQQEKIFAHARVALISFKHNNYVFPSLFLFLTYLKVIYPDFYKKIENKNISPQELLDILDNIWPKNIDEEYLNFYINLEAQLLYKYYFFHKRNDFNTLIVHDEASKKDTCTIKSRIDPNEGQYIFIRFLKEISEKERYSYTSLDFLLSRINLTEAFTKD